MDKTIRNMFLISFFLISASFDSCVLGTNYDRRHDLYPKYISMCEFCLGERVVYGERWQELSAYLFLIGFSILITTAIFGAKVGNQINYQFYKRKA